MAKTDIDDFISELGAGVFREKLEHALSEAALGTVVNGSKTKKGKITIEIQLSPVGEGDQLMVAHTLKQQIPTKRGKKYEDDTTETPMFVTTGGVMSIAPPKVDTRGQMDIEGGAGNISRIS